MKTAFIISSIALASITACAPAPNNIAAAPVSANAYAGLSCRQIRTELATVVPALEEKVRLQQTASDNDAAIVTASILFLPIAGLFAAGGADYSGEIAALRGQVNALNTASVARGC